MFLVTGGAGFIGSNIVAALNARNAGPVVVCDRLRQGQKWQNLAKRDLADIVCPDQLFETLEHWRGSAAAVVHMGAVTSTTERDADRMLDTNFRFSIRLWNWCAEAEVPFIYASSAATYGDGSQGFDDIATCEGLAGYRPLNVYGWSKHVFDRWIAFQVSEGGPTPPQWAGLKFFNVYGPNEYHKGGMKSVVAQIWPKIAADQPVTLFRSHNPAYADGGQMRDFVFVDDVVDMVDWLLDTPAVSGVFNAGSGQARSFLDLANAAFTAAGKTPRVEYVDTPESIRDKYQYFTAARMERVRAAGFGGQSTPLEEGVRRYVQDFLATADPYR